MPYNLEDDYSMVAQRTQLNSQVKMLLQEAFLKKW